MKSILCSTVEKLIHVKCIITSVTCRRLIRYQEDPGQCLSVHPSSHNSYEYFDTTCFVSLNSRNYENRNHQSVTFCQQFNYIQSYYACGPCPIVTIEFFIKTSRMGMENGKLAFPRASFQYFTWNAQNGRTKYIKVLHQSY